MTIEIKIICTVVPAVEKRFLLAFFLHVSNSENKLVYAGHFMTIKSNVIVSVDVCRWTYWALTFSSCLLLGEVNLWFWFMSIKETIRISLSLVPCPSTHAFIHPFLAPVLNNYLPSLLPSFSLSLHLISHQPRYAKSCFQRLRLLTSKTGVLRR